MGPGAAATHLNEGDRRANPGELWANAGVCGTPPGGGPTICGSAGDQGRSGRARPVHEVTRLRTTAALDRHVATDDCAPVAHVTRLGRSPKDLTGMLDSNAQAELDRIGSALRPALAPLSLPVTERRAFLPARPGWSISRQQAGRDDATVGGPGASIRATALRGATRATLEEALDPTMLVGTDDAPELASEFFATCDRRLLTPLLRTTRSRRRFLAHLRAPSFPSSTIRTLPPSSPVSTCFPSQ